MVTPPLKQIDWFAGMAMVGLIENERVARNIDSAAKLTLLDRQTILAKKAYDIAEAMLAESALR